MSGKLAGIVWDLDLPHNQAWVLMALVDHADHDGTKIFPSVDLIAWKTGYSPRQVQRVIAELVAAGLLVKVRESGQHRPNEYHAHLDHAPRKAPLTRGDKMSPLNSQARQNDTPEIPPAVTKCRPPESPRGDILRPRGDIAVSPDSYEPSDPESTTPLPPTAPAPSGGGGGVRAPGRSPAPPALGPGHDLLAREHFSPKAIAEFGGYPPDVLAKDIARMRAGRAGNGAIVDHWRLYPPGTTPSAPAEPEGGDKPTTDPILYHPGLTPQERQRYLSQFRRATSPAEQRAILDRLPPEANYA